MGKQLASCSEHFLEFRIISDTPLSPSCLPKMPFLCFFLDLQLEKLMENGNEIKKRLFQESDASSHKR